MDFTAIEAAGEEKPRPYVYQRYPSVRYHRSGDTIEVLTDDESDALKNDPDWSDTPATFVGHTAPSKAQTEAVRLKAREEARQAAIAAARAKGDELAAAKAEVDRLRGIVEQAATQTTAAPSEAPAAAETGTTRPRSSR
jgi:hypothetical protein